MRPDKAFWISFGVAGALVGIFGISHFSDQPDSWNLLLALSLGFAIAAFPWVSGLKIKGLVEIQRQIATAKDETNSKIQQTERESVKRVGELRRELQVNISSLQTQINQNLVSLTSSQRSSQITYVGSESSLEVFKALQDRREKELEQKAAKSNLPVSPEQTKLRRLESGFSLACAYAVADLPDLKCAKLLTGIIDTQTTKEVFDNAAKLSAISKEQIRMMQSLGLLNIGDEPEAGGNIINVEVTDLGIIYANYWAGTVDWALKAKDIAKTLGPIVLAALPVIGSLLSIWGDEKAEDANSK